MDKSQILVKSPPWLLVLVAVGLFGALVHKELSPPDPGRQVDSLRAAFEDYTDAFLDRDGDELWEMTSSHTRKMMGMEFERLRNLPPDSPVFEDSPFTWDDLQEVDLEEFCCVDGPIFDEFAEMFRELVIESIDVRGSEGSVGCLWRGTRPCFSFTFEENEWRMDTLYPNRTKFLTLERKLSAFLPKGRPDVDIFVQIGSPGLGPYSTERLGIVLRDLVEDLDGAPAEVLLEVSGDLTFKHLVSAVDAVLIATGKNPMYADTTRTTVPDGIRVNGVSIERIGESGAPPLPEDLPALSRIIGLR